MQKQDFKMAIRKYRKALKYQDLCWEMPDLEQGYLIFILDTNLKKMQCLNKDVLSLS